MNDLQKYSKEAINAIEDLERISIKESLIEMKMNRHYSGGDKIKFGEKEYEGILSTLELNKKIKQMARDDDISWIKSPIAKFPRGWLTKSLSTLFIEELIINLINDKV